MTRTHSHHLAASSALPIVASTLLDREKSTPKSRCPSPAYVGFVLALLSLSVWLPPAALGQAQSLGSFLDEQGRLAIPEGFTGSLDPEGFEMQTGADGSPRFVVQGGGNALPGDWETFGGVNFGCNGSVETMVIDAAGRVYLGGFFTACGETVANYVAVYDPATNQFGALESGGQNGVNRGPVTALAVSGSDLYVGGSNFREAGGQTANFVARWDGSEWHALESGGQNGVDSSVSAITVSDSDVYVGGRFIEAGGQTVNRVARWDGGEWHAIESGGDPGVNDRVRALAVSNGDLYVGGDLTEAGGQAASRVARWDGSAWHSQGIGIEDGFLRRVQALAVSGSDVFVGGVFNEAGGQIVNAIARWDGDAWHPLEGKGGIGVNSPVEALTVLHGDLYVGGSFSEAGAQPASRVARWDGSEWHALESGGENGVNNTVKALAVSGSDVYVGGRFKPAGDRTSSHITRWNGSAWQALGNSGQNGLNDQVDALAVSGSDVYVGGFFTQAGDQNANFVARWDGSEWHALGSGGQNGVNKNVVSAITVSGSDVYVGGAFNEAGGQMANGVARWDGSEWQALGSGAQNGVSSQVRALAVSGSDVYVGGSFTQAGGQTANRIARWDGSEWHALESGGQNGLDGTVFALAVSGTDVFAGGTFSEAGGLTANRIARWDGSAWNALESGGENGVNSTVLALATSGSDVYVGGFFTEAGGLTANRIARWDGSAWHALESGGQNGVNSGVRALASSGSGVYVGGSFTQVGGQSANRVARWDGNEWASLGSGDNNGVNQTIYALAVSNQSIYVGGSFGAAGGEVSSGVAIFLPDPLQVSATPATVLSGETSEISLSGGFGSGAVSLEISSGSTFCSLSGTTLTALAEGECTVTATKAADGENPEQSDSVLVRVVADAGVNLVVEIDQLPSVAQLPGTASRGQCDEIGFRIRVCNNGPLAANEVQVQMPFPSGLLPPVDWNCTVADGQCTPDSGSGAIDTTFGLAIGAAAEIDLAGCLDPNTAFVDLRVQSSLPDGTPLIFPGEAQLNLSAPVNNNGIFRSRFD